MGWFLSCSFAKDEWLSLDIPFLLMIERKIKGDDFGNRP